MPVREPRLQTRGQTNAVQPATTAADGTSSWVYVNGLGERDPASVTVTDILTALNFDKTGEYLAVGDRGGRVIVFRYTDLRNSRYFDYRYFSEI